MKRRVFYSFHYSVDAWRAGQVRNMGVVEGNQPARDNDWETIKRGGDTAIKKWINEQMHGRSCTIVLVGSQTAGRPWIDYEIQKSWDDRMGIAGVYIHGLADQNGSTATMGNNPLNPNLGIKCYAPTGQTSQERYGWIKDNLSAIIEEAIEIRQRYR